MVVCLPEGLYASLGAKSTVHFPMESVRSPQDAEDKAANLRKGRTRKANT